MPQLFQQGPPQNQLFPPQPQLQIQQFPQQGQLFPQQQQQLFPQQQQSQQLFQQQQQQQQQQIFPQQQQQQLFPPQQQLFQQQRQIIPQQQQLIPQQQLLQQPQIFPQQQLFQGLQQQPFAQVAPLSPPGFLQQGLMLQAPRTQIIQLPQPQAMSALPQQRFLLPQAAQVPQLVFSQAASPVRPASMAPIGRPAGGVARTSLSATQQGGLGVPTDFQAPQGSLMSNDDCDLLGLPPVRCARGDVL